VPGDSAAFFIRIPEGSASVHYTSSHDTPNVATSHRRTVRIGRQNSGAQRCIRREPALQVASDHASYHRAEARA
jgi:hypothetical protein